AGSRYPVGSTARWFHLGTGEGRRLRQSSSNHHQFGTRLSGAPAGPQSRTRACGGRRAPAHAQPTADGERLALVPLLPGPTIYSHTGECAGDEMRVRGTCPRAHEPRTRFALPTGPRVRARTRERAHGEGEDASRLAPSVSAPEPVYPPPGARVTRTRV